MNPAVEENKAVYREWRQHLHKHPELSAAETATVEFIREKLTEFGVPHEALAGGVVGWLKKGEGLARGFRADIDALPIKEENAFAHRSVNEDVMHACGHDGHTAMLLGAAHHLVSHPDEFNGTIYFVFQPAEEIGDGGAKMIAAGLFRTYPMERIYGMHNWPNLAVGSFATHTGPVMAAVSSFDIRIRGIGGHAAMPHLTRDPLLAACQLVSSLQSIASRNTDPNDSMVLSITSFKAGEAYNVIPADALLKGTIRYFAADLYERIEQRMKEQLAAVEANGFQTELIMHSSVPPTINDREQAKLSTEVATAVVGRAGEVLRGQLPSMGGEDFSYMLQEKPGSYIWLGNGDTASLHSPAYDFNDAALIYGVNYWIELAHRT